MKKLFVCAMALAAFVSCSKSDEPTVLESSKKAVEISISNYTPNTRAIENPVASEVKGDGQTGTIEAQVSTLAAAVADDLVVLFANNANTVEQAFALKGLTATDGKYLFHNINESVTQVAVVRKVTTATKAEDGTWTYAYDITPANFETKNLDDFRKAALVEYADNRGIEGMDLFAVSEKLDDLGTCTLPATDHDGYADGYTYKLYGATVKVKPMLARVEITSVSAQGGQNPLGSTTLKAFQGQAVSGGYDELVLGTLTFGDGTYKYDFNDFVLKGIYQNETETLQAGEREATIFKAGGDDTKYAIAWNIATSTAFPLTTANAMKIDMVASAYDYTVVNTGKNLTIGFDNVETKAFEPGKIYRLAITFGEDNLDKSNEAICVNVKVEIADWVVVDVDPVFGQPAAQN